MGRALIGFHSLLMAENSIVTARHWGWGGGGRVGVGARNCRQGYTHLTSLLTYTYAYVVLYEHSQREQKNKQK